MKPRFDEAHNTEPGEAQICDIVCSPRKVAIGGTVRWRGHELRVVKELAGLEVRRMNETLWKACIGTLQGKPGYWYEVQLVR